jgi:hypothetical protein
MPQKGYHQNFFGYASRVLLSTPELKHLTTRLRDEPMIVKVQDAGLRYTMDEAGNSWKAIQQLLRF